MTKYERSVMDMIRKAGLEPRDISHTGKHMKIRVMTPTGDVRCIIAAKTPSDHRAFLNLRTNCRHLAAA